MQNHRIAEELAAQFQHRNLNEADTRHQIIDRLLHEVLSWPHESVKCEENVRQGYIDFVLRDKGNRAVLLIEAKKEGKYFTLPTKARKPSDQPRSIRLRTLATDPEIAHAVSQAAQYCPAIGCQYACVTNGHEFIIFRAFILGRDFMDEDALVISQLQYFAERFTLAYNLLGYQAITVDLSLQRVFQIQKGKCRELNYPKYGIIHYDSPLQKNPYARFLEPLARRYFGEIHPTDSRMMDHCYVFARGTREVQDGIRSRLSDSLTQFFVEDGGQDIASTRTGGKLAERIARSLANRSPGEVLILFGGKGAGKSTFLKRILYYDPPTEFTIHAFPIIVDCIRAPQDRAELNRFLWEQITTALNLNELLAKPIEELLYLFEDRFSVAKKQELADLEVGSIEYIRVRNALVLKWKEDSLYVARRLKYYWESQGKRAVIAFDNTDQLPPSFQDHCFLAAQNIASEMQCVAIISMREERYCRARTMGVLDAYQNSGFHLAAPDLVGVFTKRIRLVIADLEASKHGQTHGILPDNAPFDDLKCFFVACLRQFRDEKNALRCFLQECSRDNTRLALEFFSQFLSSGYTHAEEMVKNPGWTVIAHQVIKPMMVPQRFNYDEDKSLIPNVYQCRTPSHGSHFTTIRILRMLRHGVVISSDQASYWRVDALVDDFNTRFGMRQDCETALDVMLRHGLIEANNRLDSYSVTKSGGDGSEIIYVDEVRITAFGIYMLDYLAPQFTYLELVSLDCGLSDEALFHRFCNAGAEERTMGINRDKDGRLRSRLMRVHAFIEYLQREETREKSEYLLAEAEDIMPSVAAAFETEQPRVLASAKKNI